MFFPTWSLTSPLKSYHPKIKIVFQLSISRVYVKLPGCYPYMFGGPKDDEEKHPEDGKPSDDDGKPSDDDGKPSDDDGKPSDDDGKPSDDDGKPSDDDGKPVEEPFEHFENWIFFWWSPKGMSQLIFHERSRLCDVLVGNPYNPFSREWLASWVCGVDRRYGVFFQIDLQLRDLWGAHGSTRWPWFAYQTKGQLSYRCFFFSSTSFTYLVLLKPWKSGPWTQKSLGLVGGLNWICRRITNLPNSTNQPTNQLTN